MGRYAASTDVTVERSRAELERTLSRYGATAFGYAWEDNRAMVQFRLAERHIRFLLPLPAKDAPEFRYTPSKGLERSEDDQQRAWERACRQRWRALNLIVKAKLEAVESGISTLEAEFLANVVLPDDTTVGQWAIPQIEQAYRTLE